MCRRLSLGDFFEDRFNEELHVVFFVGGLSSYEQKSEKRQPTADAKNKTREVMKFFCSSHY